MWLSTYFPVLIVTVLVEVLIATLLAPKDMRRRMTRDAALVNLFTHPLATIGSVDLEISFLVVEGSVLATELLIYRGVTGLTWARASLVTIIANLTTASLSFLW